MTSESFYESTSHRILMLRKENFWKLLKINQLGYNLTKHVSTTALA